MIDDHVDINNMIICSQAPSIRSSPTKTVEPSVSKKAIIVKIIINNYSITNVTIIVMIVINIPNNPWDNCYDYYK